MLLGVADSRGVLVLRHSPHGGASSRGCGGGAGPHGLGGYMGTQTTAGGSMTTRVTGAEGGRGCIVPMTPATDRHAAWTSCGASGKEVAWHRRPGGVAPRAAWCPACSGSLKHTNRDPSLGAIHVFNQ